MTSDRTLPALLLALLVTGCATPDGKFYMGGKDNFGEANRQTMAAQIIDPDPRYDTAVPDGNGAHAAAALERYRTDKVKKPERVRTSRDLAGAASGAAGPN
ncbi:hypothetical protein [Novosphingobium lindaniclasticum]|uniref:Lipoprotein n=1 Tax=Novosphingobium lindaniclasticum LE124 TaxID=1096930 RepID=T0GVF8_9SPHN|nr:hypothetical protein [Novosphingobium lindaniclasticum]EQB07956.1 hypothetical protein L284_21790 [Novosphingobium lindaniclasticum LE124]